MARKEVSTSGFVVLVGTAPGVYSSASAARAGCGDVKYFLMKPCSSAAEGEEELHRFEAGHCRSSDKRMPCLAVVYTDGACAHNGRPSATAGVGVFWGDDDPRNVSRAVSGIQTNNVAELDAIEAALDSIASAASASRVPRAFFEYRIVTDSLYAIQCLCVWYEGWKTRGWLTSSGKPVKNVDLIVRIHDKLEALGDSTVRLVHVHGHKGVPGNEAADHLAVLGSKHGMAK